MEGSMCENVLYVTTLTEGTQYIDSCNNITDFEWSDKKATITYTQNKCQFIDSTLQVGLNSNEFFTEESLVEMRKQKEIESQEKLEAKRLRKLAKEEARRQRDEARRLRNEARDEARRFRDEAREEAKRF